MVEITTERRFSVVTDGYLALEWKSQNKLIEKHIDFSPKVRYAPKPVLFRDILIKPFKF